MFSVPLFLCMHMISVLPIFLTYINLVIKLCISICNTSHPSPLSKTPCTNALVMWTFLESEWDKAGLYIPPSKPLWCLFDKILQRPLGYITTSGSSKDISISPFYQISGVRSPPSLIRFSTFVFQSMLLNQFKLLSINSAEQFRQALASLL